MNLEKAKFTLFRNEGTMSLDNWSQFVRHKICEVENGNLLHRNIPKDHPTHLFSFTTLASQNLFTRLYLGFSRIKVPLVPRKEC